MNTNPDVVQYNHFKIDAMKPINGGVQVACREYIYDREATVTEVMTVFVDDAQPGVEDCPTCVAVIRESWGDQFDGVFAARAESARVLPTLVGVAEHNRVVHRINDIIDALPEGALEDALHILRMAEDVLKVISIVASNRMDKNDTEGSEDDDQGP